MAENKKVSRSEMYASRKAYYDQQRSISRQRELDRREANRLNRAERQRLDADRQRFNRRSAVRTYKNNFLSFFTNRFVVVFLALMLIAPMVLGNITFNPSIVEDDRDANGVIIQTGFDKYKSQNTGLPTISSILKMLEQEQSGLEVSPAQMIIKFLNAIRDDTGSAAGVLLGPVFGFFSMVLTALQDAFSFIMIFFRLVFGIY